MSGFGLSLTKWTLIVKKSTDFATGAGSASGSNGDVAHNGFFGGGFDHNQNSHHGGSIHANLSKSDDTWLWWLIMAFGLFICIKAILQYLRIKRTWMSLSNAARERLFFFY